MRDGLILFHNRSVIVMEDLFRVLQNVHILTTANLMYHALLLSPCKVGRILKSPHLCLVAISKCSTVRTSKTLRARMPARMPAGSIITSPSHKHVFMIHQFFHWIEKWSNLVDMHWNIESSGTEIKDKWTCWAVILTTRLVATPLPLSSSLTCAWLWTVNGELSTQLDEVLRKILKVIGGQTMPSVLLPRSSVTVELVSRRRDNRTL